MKWQHQVLLASFITLISVAPFIFVLWWVNP